MKNQNKETVLITGATRGIGYELSRLFAADGYRLVLVARDYARLEEVAKEMKRDFGAESMILGKDLSIAGAPGEIFHQLSRESVSVDVLVNNAGAGVYGHFIDQDWAAVKMMLDLNMIALTHLTRIFLPGMVKRGAGRILNVASTAAFQPGPLMACYFASKAYVLFFTEAVRREVKGSGVTVCAFCPGPTATEFQKRTGIEHIREGMIGMMSAARAARAGYQGLMKRKGLVVPGLANRILAFAVRFTPRTFAVRVVQFLQESTGSKQMQ